MKHFFLFIILTLLANYCFCMETLLRQFTGEHITKYLDTKPQEQELPFHISNNSHEDILVQATYACKVRFLYATMRHLGHFTTHAFEGITDCNDTPIRCNRNKTIELTPVLQTLATSKIRLIALKVCSVDKPGNWVSVSLPTTQCSSTFLSLDTLKK